MGFISKLFNRTINQVAYGAKNNLPSEIDQVGGAGVNRVKSTIAGIGERYHVADVYPSPPGIVQLFNERTEQTKIRTDLMNLQVLKTRTLITQRTIITPDGILKER